MMDGSPESAALVDAALDTAQSRRQLRVTPSGRLLLIALLDALREEPYRRWAPQQRAALRASFANPVQLAGALLAVQSDERTGDTVGAFDIVHWIEGHICGPLPKEPEADEQRG